MLNRDDYRYRLATKMVDKFLKDLKEKTGLRASIMMDHLNPSKENAFLGKIVSLEMLEEIFLEAYPVKSDINPLHTKGRKIEHVEARCVFCHIAREKLKFSYPGIGNYIQKDHSSIMHMTRRANNLLDTDDKFYNLYYKTIENLKIVYAKNFTEYNEREHKS